MEQEATDAPTAAPVEVLAPGELAARLPAAVGGLARADVDTSAQSALGAEVAEASARYGDGAASVTLTDLGTAEMVEMMGYGWGLGGGAEQVDGHPARVEAGVGGAATVRVVVGERFVVEAAAEGGRDVAEAAVRGVDLAGLAAAAGR